MFFQLAQVKATIFVHRQLDNRIAVIFQLPANRQHSRMLDSGSYDFTFVRRRSQRAFDGGVVTLGTAACKYNLTRLTAEQAGHLLAGLTDSATDLSAECVHT